MLPAQSAVQPWLLKSTIRLEDDECKDEIRVCVTDMLPDAPLNSGERANKNPEAIVFHCTHAQPGAGMGSNKFTKKYCNYQSINQSTYKYRADEQKGFQQERCFCKMC